MDSLSFACTFKFEYQRYCFFRYGWLVYRYSEVNPFKGIETLGASINASIFAIYPLFGSLLAVFLLSERPSPGILVGMICILCGVVLIERNLHGSPFKSASPARMRIIFLLSVALSLGFAYVLRKMGLNTYIEPIAGVAITYLSSLCFLLFLAVLSTRVRGSLTVSRRNVRLFWRPGLVICAQLSTYYALRYGDVSTVTPLMNVEPFFVFILAYLVLREQEKITYKLVIGTLFIVVGISLINMF